MTDRDEDYKKHEDVEHDQHDEHAGINNWINEAYRELDRQSNSVHNSASRQEQQYGRDY